MHFRRSTAPQPAKVPVVQQLANTGKIRIRTNVTAKYTLDGKTAQDGGTFLELEMPPGRHTLVIDAPGYSRVEQIIVVVAGRLLPIDIQLHN